MDFFLVVLRSACSCAEITGLYSFYWFLGISARNEDTQQLQYPPYLFAYIFSNELFGVKSQYPDSSGNG